MANAANSREKGLGRSLETSEDEAFKDSPRRATEVSSDKEMVNVASTQRLGIGRGKSVGSDRAAAVVVLATVILPLQEMSLE